MNHTFLCWRVDFPSCNVATNIWPIKGSKNINYIFLSLVPHGSYLLLSFLSYCFQSLYFHPSSLFSSSFLHLLYVKQFPYSHCFVLLSFSCPPSFLVHLFPISCFSTSCHHSPANFLAWAEHSSRSSRILANVHWFFLEPEGKWILFTCRYLIRSVVKETSKFHTRSMLFLLCLINLLKICAGLSIGLSEFPYRYAPANIVTCKGSTPGVYFEAREYFFRHRVQASSEANHNRIRWRPWINLSETKANHTPSSSVEVKNAWRFTPTNP
jgi:hypothetical protein